MSVGDADPVVLHRCIRVGWVPEVVDENTSLRLQVALLTGQRDELAREVAALAATVGALGERVRAADAADAARLARDRRPSAALVAWAALCGLWFVAWDACETDASRAGGRR